MGPQRQSGSHVESSPTKILLIEDSAIDAQLVRALLRADAHFSVTTATRLARGLALLGRDRFDLVLLDLSLPDGNGLDVISQVNRAARQVPIVALSGSQHDELALQALRAGAQDWLVKGEIDRSLLVRVIHYACERHRLLAALQSLALMDTLTGLYNRRGFVTIAEEQLKLARRAGYSVALAFVDLDGMKRINDELGHEFGDQALVATAHILRSTFRASDVIARLGGDEFIVLANAAEETVSTRIRKRLSQSLLHHNRTPGAVRVAFSVGFAHYNPLKARQTTIEELMTAADHAMYVEKQSHHGSRAFQEKAVKPKSARRAAPGPLAKAG